jgi:hypothetical protein
MAEDSGLAQHHRRAGLQRGARFSPRRRQLRTLLAWGFWPYDVQRDRPDATAGRRTHGELTDSNNIAVGCL